MFFIIKSFIIIKRKKSNYFNAALNLEHDVNNSFLSNL